MEISYLAALLVGLMGSTHCIGMCGGIVGALNAGPDGPGRSPAVLVIRQLSYNAGRITSYALAGTLAGLIGSQVSALFLDIALPVGKFIAGLFLIGFGLHLAGWWRAFTALEKLGLRLWRRIEPLGRRFLPATTPGQAFGLGMVWGWLPCGFVYSILPLAMASASPQKGGLIMIAFGIGTLPMLVAMGAAAGHIARLARKPVVRQTVAVVIIAFGIYACATTILGTGHQHRADGNADIKHETGEPHAGDH